MTEHPVIPADARWRRWCALAFVLLGHAVAAGLLATGHWRWALLPLLPAALVLVWGSLWPHSRLFGPVLRRLPTATKHVWLTFDDGPDADTPALLDVLDRHGARATFFLVGERAARHPELVRAIAARGHDIGNHSHTHPSARFWMLTPAAYARELREAQAVLRSLGGRWPRWFRAVAGLTNPFLAPVLHRLGLVRVSWSGRGFDTVDADDACVLGRLVRAIRPGAILMLHQGLAPGRAPRLADALLRELVERGYSTMLPEPDGAGVATTSQLLNGVLPHHGVKVADSPSDASSASRLSRVG